MATKIHSRHAPVSSSSLTSTSSPSYPYLWCMCGISLRSKRLNISSTWTKEERVQTKTTEETERKPCHINALDLMMHFYAPMHSRTLPHASLSMLALQRISLAAVLDWYITLLPPLLCHPFSPLGNCVYTVRPRLMSSAHARTTGASRRRHPWPHERFA
jgi:hypothetical protein